MKFRKWPLLAVLSFATLLIMSCGEDKDKRLSDADVLCLKIQTNGGTCANGSTATGTTTTTTATQTQTVTVINTSS